MADETGELASLRRNWERFGEDDPLWAVLTDPGKRGGRWDPDAFYATGEQEITALLADLAAHELPRARGVALDFGCGAGRLTRALASRFERVVSVDISSAMIATAKKLVPAANVTWMHETSGALPQVADATVDLVYSNITLQHIPPPHALPYVAEFMRVLKPGGVAVFHVPTSYDWSPRGMVHRALPRFAANILRRILFRSQAVMEMHPLPEADIRRVAGAAGGVFRAVEPSDTSGPAFVGRRYVIEKRRGKAG